ncbi:hypothetical protein [Methyloversatilis sp. RAC08]|uniref:hypothetical protein n=1 Tax=Methyloversatilis sp. RAC08 TaxID=1842540 RepID=UPI00083CD779|nr:hypothetical protein [Methyloversatilis sp. RAC08]
MDIRIGVDKRTGERRKSQIEQKRLGRLVLFLAVSVMFYWLSFRVFTALDCEFFGSKLALAVVPACAILGNHCAAAIPFALASVSLLLAVRSQMYQRPFGDRHGRRN